MSKKTERLRRLLHAQEQLHKSTMQAVEQTVQQKKQLRAREASLVKLMAEGDPVLVNALMASHAKQLKKVARERAELDQALEILQQQLRKHGTTMESVKRFLSMVEAKERKEQEKQDNLDILELVANKTGDGL
ncbi:hypothetical protein [uncultured Cohaesibacter sp.]|uniref:hypothetical protein n=1 Tax=uncultured Cohaesibacter sp. TaxID=1002546 RepID=UPI0029C77E14|nr:hypothetical protein [uncultured Cohaesibacter sp.]